VYMRYSLQGFHEIYGRRMFMVLADPSHEC